MFQFRYIGFANYPSSPRFHRFLYHVKSKSPYHHANQSKKGRFRLSVCSIAQDSWIARLKLSTSVHRKSCCM